MNHAVPGPPLQVIASAGVASGPVKTDTESWNGVLRRDWAADGQVGAVLRAEQPARPARGGLRLTAYCCPVMDARFSLAGEGPGDSGGPAGGAGASDQQRLRRVLGGPELGWLIDRIRIRLERGEPVDGTVTLVGATAEQRRAAARLLGHGIGRGTSLSVPLPEVDAALRRAGISSGLRSAVESLTGPVRDRAAERSTEIRQFQDVLDGARRSPLAAAPWHLAWLEEISRDGTLTRLVRQGQGHLLAPATAVLERLPAGPDESAVLLPALAEAVTGDPKALDGTALSALVLRALALRDPAGPGAERALWATAGVVSDDLASQVLVLNVRAVGDGPGDRNPDPLAQQLRLAGAAEHGGGDPPAGRGTVADGRGRLPRRAAREHRVGQGPARREPVGSPAGRADARQRPGRDRGAAAHGAARGPGQPAGPALSLSRAAAEPERSSR